MRGPSVSVVIPVYNEESSISSCLNALLEQSERIHEIIVVDNNSTDATADIVGAYAGRVVPVTLLTERRQGAHFARRRGVEEATGDLIARIDADTIVGSGWVSAIRMFFAAAPSDVAGGSGICSMHDMPAQRVFRSLQAKAVARAHAELADGRVTVVKDTFGANFVMRAETWRAVSSRTSDRTDIMEDLDLGLTVCENGWRLALIPGMEAQISGRRLCTSPRSFWEYTARSPRTYRLHGRWFRMAAAWVGIQPARVIHACAYPVLQYWDPERRSFRLDNTIRVPERVLP